MSSQEFNKCDFCGELRPVLRFYLRCRNKHFDDNKQGQYSTFISYCSDCGIKTNTTDRLVSLCEEYVNDDFPKDYLFKLTEIIHHDSEIPRIKLTQAQLD